MSAAAQAPMRLSVVENFGRNIFRQGADSIAAALKIISDLTAQEIALVVGMVRERVTLRPLPGAMEAAGQAVTGFTDAGKILLDLAAGESTVLVEGMKELLAVRPSVAALADLVPRGVGTLIEMQKSLLDAIGTQTKEIVEAYVGGKPLMPGSRAAKMARVAVESFIDTQKKFLDQVAEQVTIATEGGEKAKPAAKRDRSKVLIQLSRDGVEKFISAQKQVLDLVIEEIEAGEAHPRSKPAPRTSMAQLTQKSVQNFTQAQKSLLDLALKPAKADGETAKPRARRRAAPRRRAAAATT